MGSYNDIIIRSDSTITPPAQETSVQQTKNKTELDTQEVANKVFNSKIESNPLIKPKASQLQQGIDNLKIRKIANGITQAATHTAPSEAGQTHFKLNRIPGSANPVTKLESEFHIPKQAIVDSNPVIHFTKLQAKEAFQTALFAVNSQIRNNPAIPPAEKEALVKQMNAATVSLYKMSVENTYIEGDTDNLSRIFYNLNQSSGIVLRQFQSSPQFAKYQKQLTQEITKNVNNFDSTIHIEGVQTKYSKDEVLSHLRAQVAHLSKNSWMGTKFNLGKEKINKDGSDLSSLDEKIQPQQHRLTQITNAIKSLSKNPSEFITADELKCLGLPEKSLASVQKNSTEYVSATEVTHVNAQRTNTAERLKSIGNINPEYSPSYAFKLGEENSHEMLANHLTSSLGLNTFILSKAETTLPHAALENETNPQGIRSRWIEGSNFPRDKWDNWLNVKAEFKRAQAQNKVTPELKEKFEQTKNEILTLGGSKGIAAHIVTDIVLMANDSHIGQFKFAENKELYSFDVARFFAPGPVYSQGGSFHAAVRSDLLDHPLAEESITTSSPHAEALLAIKEHVLSWNPDQIEKEWQQAGLIGTKEYFEQASKKITQLENDYRFLTSSTAKEADVRIMASSYGVPNTGTVNEVRERIISKIKSEFKTQQKEMWTKAHPSAVKEMKERIGMMQEYFRTEPTPTLAGAWKAYYPELAPFHEALEIMDRNPGTGIMLQKESREAIAQANYLTKLGKTPKVEPSPGTPIQAKFAQGVTKAMAYTKGTSQRMKTMTEGHLPEMMLPNHYYGERAHTLWKVWASSSTKDNFIDWVAKLEKGEEVPGKENAIQEKIIDENGNIAISKVHYMSTSERLKTYLTLDETGTASNGNGILHTHNTPHIFVAVGEEDILVTPYKMGEINHSSFFSGRPVKAAGELFFENGKLNKITNKSGHYKPDDRMVLNSLRMLQTKGFDLNSVEFEDVITKTKTNAMKMLKSLELKEMQEKIFTQRSLNDILILAKNNPAISNEQINSMEEQLAKFHNTVPTQELARTGSPGL